MGRCYGSVNLNKGLSSENVKNLMLFLNKETCIHAVQGTSYMYLSQRYSSRTS